MSFGIFSLDFYLLWSISMIFCGFVFLYNKYVSLKANGGKLQMVNV